MSAAQQTIIKPIERGIELLDRVDYRLAETQEDKDTIYRLRYRAYLNEGAIEPNRDQKITDKFDDMPNSWIFGVYLDGRLASSIRLSISSPEHSMCPSVDVFGDYLQQEVDQGKVMVDPLFAQADHPALRQSPTPRTAAPAPPGSRSRSRRPWHG